MKRSLILITIAFFIISFLNIIQSFEVISYILFIIPALIISKYAIKTRAKGNVKALKKDYICYFLISLYPIFHIWIINIKEIFFSVFLIALIFFLLLSFFVFLISKIFLLNDQKAVLVSAILMFFINFAGYFNEFSSGFLALILFLIFIVLISKKYPIKIFYVFSCALLICLVSDFALSIDKINLSNNNKIEAVKAKDINKENDVYIILADMYAGSEILNSEYSYDNSKFYKELDDLGFYVFDSVYSNYNKTIATLGSIFNGGYIKDIGYNSFYEAFSKSKMFKKALENNYDTYIATSEPAKFNIKDSYFNKIDLYNSSYKKEQLELFEGSSIFNGICEHFLPKENEKENIEILSKLNNPNKSFKARFWFLHIMAPHYPYINPNNPYGRDDFLVSNKTYEKKANKKAYISYLEYTNKEILNAVKTVIKNSKKPPIIVIFGDHGPRLHYYLSNEKKYFKTLSKEKNLLKAHFNTFFAIYCPKNEVIRYKNAKSLINFFIEFQNARFNENNPKIKDKFYYIYYDEEREFKVIENGSVELKLKNNDFIPLTKD